MLFPKKLTLPGSHNSYDQNTQIIFYNLHQMINNNNVCDDPPDREHGRNIET